MPKPYKADESTPRAVVAQGNDYPAAFELPEHRHRRNQFLYATKGVLAVTTPHGSWVAPPERAVWIPAETPHSVRMVGAVQTRSVLIDPTRTGRGATCQIVGVSALLRQLLVTAVELPREYDEAGRDGLVMELLRAEIERAPVIPLAVPFPSHQALAARCHAFLDAPRADSTIDEWARALGMSRRSFTRLFRNETGMSFVAWRQQACLSAALPKLAAGEQVTTVALDLGYETSASFSTMFKRAVGVPPSRYLR